MALFLNFAGTDGNSLYTKFDKNNFTIISNYRVNFAEAAGGGDFQSFFKQAVNLDFNYSGMIIKYIKIRSDVIATLTDGVSPTSFTLNEQSSLIKFPVFSGLSIAIASDPVTAFSYSSTIGYANSELTKFFQKSLYFDKILDTYLTPVNHFTHEEFCKRIIRFPSKQNTLNILVPIELAISLSGSQTNYQLISDHLIGELSTASGVAYTAFTASHFEQEIIMQGVLIPNEKSKKPKSLARF